MTHKTSRILAVALTGALVLGGTTAAQAKRPVHHTSGKLAKGGKGATLRYVVAGQDAGAAIANLCDTVHVTSVSARQVRSDGTFKGKTRGTSLKFDAWNVTDAGTGLVTSYCDVTYTSKYFAVGKGVKYKVNVTQTCTADLLLACTADVWTTGGATPVTLAADTAAYVDIAATAAILDPAAPASLHFAKKSVGMRNKSKLKNSLVTLTYAAPVAP